MSRPKPRPSLSWADFVSALDEERRYEAEERAAIIQYDGKTTREEAERRALALMRGSAPEQEALTWKDRIR